MRERVRMRGGQRRDWPLRLRLRLRLSLHRKKKMREKNKSILVSLLKIWFESVKSEKDGLVLQKLKTCEFFMQISHKKNIGKEYL